MNILGEIMLCKICKKPIKIKGYTQKYCKECAKIIQNSQKKEYREENRDKIKVVKGFLICKVCGKKEKRITYRQRMCKDCSKKRRELQYNIHRDFINKKIKGKTNEEMYGKERAQEIFNLKRKGIRSKNIICKTCGKTEIRTATRQIYCKKCGKARDNLSKHKWAKNNKQYGINYKKKYRIKNKDKIREKSNIYREQNKEKIRKKGRMYGRQYYWKNKEKITEKLKLNKDKRNKTRRIYRKNNPIKTRQTKWRRRAMESNIIEDFSNKEWLDKLETTKGFCPKCKRYIGIWKLTLDHIYPISLAYKDYLKTGVKRVYTIDDVQPLCQSCNSGKKDKVVA